MAHNSNKNMKLQTLWLDVEVSPGSDIEDTCRDAVKLADKLGLTVWFDFNGVKCGVRPGDDWSLLVCNWRGVLESKSPNKIACANPLNDQELSHAGQ
jgi:hypothetical protein